MNVEFEGLFTIETWNGEPDQEGSTLKQSYSGKNALNKDFKENWINAIRRSNNDSIAYNNNAWLEGIMGADYFKGKDFTVGNVGGMSFRELGIYMTEEEGELEAYYARKDKDIHANGSMARYLIYSKNKQAALSHPLRIHFTSTSDFMSPMTDVGDSNILKILEEYPDEMQQYADTAEATLSQSNLSVFKQTYTPEGDIRQNQSLYNFGIMPPIDMSGKTLEWIQNYTHSNTYAPSGMTFNMKQIGISNSENGIRVSLTQHVIEGGFKIESTDYLKITYYVIAKISMPLPKSTTNNVVEIFGKNNTFADISLLDFSVVGGGVAPAIPQLTPQYLDMLRRLGTRAYGADIADKIVENTKKTNKMKYAYNYSESGSSLISVLCGMGLKNGVGQYGTVRYGSYQDDHISTYLASNLSDNVHKGQLSQDIVDSFIACDPSATLKDYFDSVKLYINKLKPSSWFQHYRGNINPYKAMGKESISGQIQPLNARVKVLYNATLMPENGTLIATLVNAPANTQHVWSTRGWLIEVCCPFIGINIRRVIHFKEPIVKDHLNSLKWNASYHLFNAGQYPDDSGAFLDAVRNNPVSTEAQRILKRVEGQ